MRLLGKGARPRGAPVEITFDGRTIPALEGETAAAALSAAEIIELRRTRKGTPRGLWCGMGACFECLVTIDGRANQRACLAKVQAGMRIQSSTEAGSAPLAPPPGTSPGRRTTDVLVVGAGPAGLEAATTAARAGARVVVLDERPAPGGQYFKPLASSLTAGSGPLDRQFAAGAALVEAARSAGVEIVSEATVWGAFSPTEIGVLIGGAAVVFDAGALVLAAGAYERPVPVPGWTLPGVMTTGALQTLARAYRVSPGRRVLIAGNGPLNLQTALELVAGGVEVAGVVETAPRPGVADLAELSRMALASPDLALDGARMLLRLRAAGVPIYWSSRIAAVEPEEEGLRSRIESVDGRSAILSVGAGILALGYGFIPSTELSRMLGLTHRYVDRHVGYLTVATDGEGGTAAPEVFVAGDGAEIGGARVAAATGVLAGARAAMRLGFAVDEAVLTRARAALSRAARFQEALWKIFSAPRFDVRAVDDGTIVCRCEEVTASAIRRAIAVGGDSAGAVKRLTRAGMGRCQGRNCAAVVSRLVAAATGDAPDEWSFFAPRAPSKPVPAAALAFEQAEWGGHKELEAAVPRTRCAGPRGRVEEADVLVVGGGILGVSVAYHLAEEGFGVLVAERDEPNLQASGANAGSLHVQLLSFDFGGKAQAGGGPAAATLRLGPPSVALWRELERKSGESFEIRTTGGLMVAENEVELKFLEAKVAVERRHGIEADVIGAGELRRMAPALSETLVGAELCPLEGKINPLTATYAVARLAQARGARLLRGVDVTAIERTTSGFRVTTTTGEVRCGRIVNATGPWSPRIGRMVGVDLPVHGAPLQMIVTEPAAPLLTQLVAHAGRHLSLKQADAGGLVIGGGWTATADKATGFAKTLRTSIEGNLWVARRVLPALDGLHVVRTWAAMNVNLDGAPLLGETPGVPGFYNAVTANGYTLAPIVGKLTAELMRTGRASLDPTPFSLSRFARAPA